MSRGGYMSESQNYPSGGSTRKPSRRLRNIFLAVFLIACCIYPFAKIQWAHNRVDAFFNAVNIGMPVDVGKLETIAKDFGLQKRLSKATEDQTPRLLAWEGWAFGRWFCEVEFSQGRVANKKVFFLD